ncbi:MAG: hypothetical protein A2Y10_05510 [Planctomycetes bacterium GWF2_41_51]|nr:MAG: hypothetical protein A2Y10_05510 [Planctomycetes bacterium GWF2_41_51]HBG26784.1 hypothetical protein [Phycisphaerales bacterium]
MTKLMYVSLCVCLGVVLCGIAQANLLQNGDFEQGDVAWLGDHPSIPGWTYWGTDGWHMSDAGYVKDAKGMLVWWDSVGMYQDVFDVIVGQEYEFSVEAITKSADKLKGWDLVMRAEWTAENWATISSTDIGRFVGAKSESDPGDGTDTWKLISGTSIAPEGAAHGKIYFQLVQAGDWGYTGGSVCFDNASVVLVPEPMTMALLGIGGLLFVRRRK